MASIARRLNGSYQATVRTGVNAEGKQMRVCLTRKTLKEAKIAVHEFEQIRITNKESAENI